MWWYDSSINNIRSKTSILAVRKPKNPEPRRPRVFRLDESSLSFAGFYGFKTVEIEVFDLILLIDESYHLIVQVFLWKIPWCQLPQTTKQFKYLNQSSVSYAAQTSYLLQLWNAFSCPLKQQTRRWFRPWWLGNVKSMMHPVYQK